MTPRDFCSWFQGAFEMAIDKDGRVSFNPDQAAKIGKNLRLALNRDEDDSSSSSGGSSGEMVYRC